MTGYEIAEKLRQLNRWRRGDDETLLMPDPAAIGRWIDAAADALELRDNRAADLARVTAEREAEFRRSDSELAAAAQKESALRARVAELEKDRDDWKKCADLAERALASEQHRSAELEAALRDAVGMLEELDGLDWGEEGMPFDVDFSHFAKVLARAESGAQKEVLP